jgi:hypothetical protein
MFPSNQLATLNAGVSRGAPVEVSRGSANARTRRGDPRRRDGVAADGSQVNPYLSGGGI